MHRLTRTDLLALTAEDLALLANRGTVKRAQRDVESGRAPTVEEADDGAITAVAPDATVVLPPGVRIEEARCTCPATSICRHAVTAVLAYQGVAAAAGHEAAEQGADAPAPPGPWNPGTITDDALVRAARRGIVERARTRAAAGVAVSVLRAAKPVAHLHDEGVTVRFLVPGDAAWAHCSCTAAAPCEHAVLAVLAFRELPPDRERATVELGHRPPADPALLAVVEAVVTRVAQDGVASGRATLATALEHAAARARGGGWAWPADALDELAEACRRHAAADPTFTPLDVVRLVGEVLARLDALEGGTVPPAIVGGGAGRTDIEIRGGVLVGLGVRAGRLGAVSRIEVLLYDTQTSRVVNATRVVPDGDGEPAPFARVAAAPVRRGITHADLGGGQLVAKGARITPAGRLVLGRRPAAVSPQALRWETTLGAFAAESFVEAWAVADGDLPPVLAARTAASGFGVVAVDALQDGGWDPAEHAVVGTLRDATGGTATLHHPYTSQGAAGVEALLQALANDRGTRVRFVAGHLSRTAGGLRVQPTAIVLADAAGRRTMVQPWIAEAPSTATPGRAALEDGLPADRTPVSEVRAALADLLTAGVRRPDGTTRRRWQDLDERLEGAGSTVLLPLVRRVRDAVERGRAGGSDVDAATAALELAVLLAVAPAI